MPLTSGSRLGPYEIAAPIGAGGMGEVFRARDTKLGREVAIKVLPASFAEDRNLLARFEQEARMTSALNHLRQAFRVCAESTDDVTWSRFASSVN